MKMHLKHLFNNSMRSLTHKELTALDQKNSKKLLRVLEKNSALPKSTK
ncbi:UNVERIFIED_CONTAM: hypothetical protein GTU68_014258 [Idotea baltica]|nr:hypothetical protein [Idotea baltica]